MISNLTTRGKNRVALLVVAILAIAAACAFSLLSLTQSVGLQSWFATRDIPYLSSYATRQIRSGSDVALLHAVKCVTHFDAPEQGRLRLLGVVITTAADENVGSLLNEIACSPEHWFVLLAVDDLHDNLPQRCDPVMTSWLNDDTVIWTDDARQIRKCDMAAYYFRRRLGYKRFDEARALDASIEVRNAFLEEVRQAVARP